MKNDDGSAGDPLIAAALAILDEIAGEIRTSIRDASAEALNWRPGGDDTNSIAVLAVHAMSSTRSWISVAVGAPLPERDRPSEFRASTEGAVALMSFVDEMYGECRALIASASQVDWTAMRRTHSRPNAGATEEVTAAWALVHAIEHLREHTGQMSLTRQLFDRAPHT